MTGAILLLLGAVFAVAGISKLLSPDPFRTTLRKLMPQTVAHPATYAIPVQELVLAAWLLSGLAPRLAAAVTILVLLGFSSVLLRIWRLGLSCGCFGAAAESAPAGLARNAAMILLAACVALPDVRIQGPWAGGAGTVVARLTIALGAACFWTCAVAVVRRRQFIFATSAVR
jgi:uncharacterized membrane protein YphA (DoxX/SURF4 family)